MRKAFAILFVALCLSACGGGGDSPAATTPNTDPVTLTIRAARLPQDPVISALVTTEDYRVFTTDGNGAVVLSASDVGKKLSITAQGYTGPSIIVFRPVEQKMTHYLLPDDVIMPFTFIKEAFYANRDNQPLWRPAPGHLSVELSAEGWSDSRVSDALAWGIATINNAQKHVSFDVVPAGQTGVVKMYHDPADPIFQTPGYENVWAVTFITINGSVVVGARIVWRIFLDGGGSNWPEYIGNAMAHELAHVAGIRGHPCCGIMNNSSGPVVDFSRQEKDTLGYLFLRPQGTRAPDNMAVAPQQVSAYAQSGQTEVQICVLHQ
ncbi:MAG: hypothetical protein NUV49_02170 [Patescibacteria group bacterium]|nr:hypothetical protein [Patescibacteria group bacterium]